MNARIILVILTLFFAVFGQAQIRSTKEAKVVLVVDSKSDAVTHLMLFAKVQQMKNKQLISTYPNSKFFIGVLEGSFELTENEIIPEKGATIIIYTERQFYPIEPFTSDEKYAPGDDFNIGNTKSKVISSKKGELILKT